MVAMKLAAKAVICGAAVYAFAEVLSSQENSINRLRLLESKTRESLPLDPPEVCFYLEINVLQWPYSCPFIYMYIPTHSLPTVFCVSNR